MFNNLPKHKLILRIFLSVSVCVFLVLSVFHLTAKGGTTPSVYFLPQEQTVQKNEEVLVNINISDVIDLYSFQISLTYNPSILEYQGVSEGSFLNEAGQTTTMAQQPILGSGQILGYSVSRIGTKGKTGSGNLAVFRFLTKNSGSSDLNFITSGAHQLKLHNSNLDILSKNYTNGKINVTSSGTSPAPTPTPPPSSTTAKFNFMIADNKTLRLKNRTRNDTYWAGAISAAPGDKIAFNVYYHNGIEDSLAKNTKIKLSFPEASQETITIKAELSADNAPLISDSVKINLNTPQNLNFDNYVKWYADRTNQNYLSRPLTIKSNYVEVNIGDIKGCWEYQGQIVFEAQLTNLVPAGVLELNTQIRNLTQVSVWGQTVSAWPNDEIYFEIKLQAKNYDLNNVIIKNQLPNYLTYQTGSLSASGVSQKIGDLFSNSGLNIGKIKTSQIVAILFKAKVGAVPLGATNLVNKVLVQADNNINQQQTQTINVNYTDCSPSLSGPCSDVI